MTVNDTAAPISVRDRGRFAVPQPLDGAVERDRLDSCFAVARGRVVVVIAPAGYGKTTLAARWARTDGRVARWLDLEPVDDDPICLMRSILTALSPVDRLEPAPVPTNPSRDTFDRALAAVEQPIVLVIDDVDHVRSPAAAAVIERLARVLVDGSTLVLVGRDLHESLGSALRLSPGTIEMGSEDLAFDSAETATMIGRRVPSDVADVFAATASRLEGWPAGLALAVSNLQRGAFDGAAPAEQFVVTVWLDQLDDAERTLLAELACLGRFHPDMCGEVLGRTGCRSELRRLRRRQFVLDALGERGDWLRLHPIVGDWLSRELRSDRPERWLEIHRAASVWWERAGDPDLAYEFAATMGDTGRSIAIIAAHGGAFVAGGRHRTVQRWFESLDDEVIRAEPQLCAIAAVVETQLGDFVTALRWSRALGHVAERQPVSEAVRRQVAICEAAFELRSTSELRPALEDAVRQSPPGPWRAFGCWALGAFRYLHGDVVGAIEVLDEGAFEARIAGVHRLEANNTAMRATLEYLEGSSDATADAEVAYRRLEETVPDVTPSSANLVALVALAEARGGRRDRAAATIRRVEDMLSGYGPVSGWYQAYTDVVLADAALRIGDGASARRFVDAAVRLLEREDATHRLASHLETLTARVAAAEVTIDPVWALTTAELNVLRFLPTNLSLGDIATELFVSRNTVKSHAASIYRKFGTTSRSETVDKARAAGLLSSSPPA